MNKPITIKIEELKTNIANAINESNLHIYIINSVIKDFYNETNLLCDRQLVQDKNEYESFLKSEISANNDEKETN